METDWSKQEVIWEDGDMNWRQTAASLGELKASGEQPRKTNKAYSSHSPNNVSQVTF